MKLEFYWQIFEKCSNIKFYEISSSGSRAERRTDGRGYKHDEADSRSSQFCQGA